MVLGYFYDFKKSFNDVFRSEFFRFRFVSKNNPMTQYISTNISNIFWGNVSAVFRKGPGLGSPD
jgi:hypothetical protein